MGPSHFGRVPDRRHDRADAAGALIVTLRTPSRVLDSTRTIVSRMIAARTPIVV
jgi:membrane-bound ClpP family serine protease